MTGTMVANIAKVSKGEMIKSNTIVPRMNKNDLTNMDTFVLRPSYTTDVSELSRLTYLVKRND